MLKQNLNNKENTNNTTNTQKQTNNIITHTIPKQSNNTTSNITEKNIENIKTYSHSNNENKNNKPYTETQILNNSNLSINHTRLASKMERLALDSQNIVQSHEFYEDCTTTQNYKSKRKDRGNKKNKRMVPNNSQKTTQRSINYNTNSIKQELEEEQDIEEVIQEQDEDIIEQLRKTLSIPTGQVREIILTNTLHMNDGGDPMYWFEESTNNIEKIGGILAIQFNNMNSVALGYPIRVVLKHVYDICYHGYIC